MGLIFQEKFDSVPAPTLPSGWTASGAGTWTTATADGTVSPTSPSNMAKMVGSSTFPGWLIYGTPDGNSGNVSIYCNLNEVDSGIPGNLGIVARCSSTTPGSTDHAYIFRINWNLGDFAISKFSGGSLADLATLTGVGGYVQWDTFVVGLNSSSLSLAVQRANGDWLSPGGAWQATQATALTATDGTIAGSGLFGLVAFENSGTFDALFDDFAVYTFGSGPSQGSPLRPLRVASPRRPARGRIIAPRFASPGVPPPFTLRAPKVVRTPSRPRRGLVVYRPWPPPGVPATPPILPGMSPRVKASRPRRSGGKVWLPGLPAISAEDTPPPGSRSALRPQSRPTRPAPGRAMVGSLLHFVAPVVPGDLLPLILRPVARRERPPHAGSAVVGRWLHFIPPVDPGPIAFAYGRSALRPHHRDERRFRPYGRAWLGASRRLTIGPGVHYLIYSNSGAGDPIDYDSPIAITDDTTWLGGILAVPGTWEFGVRAENEYGVEQNIDAVVTIVLDPNGVDISNRPNPPTGLRAFPVGANAIRVEWYFPPVRGPKAPVGFNVYSSIGAVLSYGTPADTVLFGDGLFNAFHADLPGLVAGTPYIIGVRSFNASGEEANANTVAATPSGSGPLAVVGLVAVASV